MQAKALWCIHGSATTGLLQEAGKEVWQCLSVAGGGQPAGALAALNAQLRPPVRSKALRVLASDLRLTQRGRWLRFCGPPAQQPAPRAAVLLPAARQALHLLLAAA